jgi:hypothetical protein
VRIMSQLTNKEQSCSMLTGHCCDWRWCHYWWHGI